MALSIISLGASTAKNPNKGCQPVQNCCSEYERRRRSGGRVPGWFGLTNPHRPISSDRLCMVLPEYCDDFLIRIISYDCTCGISPLLYSL